MKYQLASAAKYHQRRGIESEKRKRQRINGESSALSVWYRKWRSSWRKSKAWHQRSNIAAWRAGRSNGNIEKRSIMA
jgi:hypothetical protein